MDAFFLAPGIQPRRAQLCRIAAAFEIGEHFIDDILAVDAVGADGAGRAALGPADHIEPLGDAPLVILDDAFLDGQAFQDAHLIADTGDQQLAVDLIGLPGADGLAIDDPVPLEPDAADRVIAQNLDRARQEIEMDGAALDAMAGGDMLETAQEIEVGVDHPLLLLVLRREVLRQLGFVRIGPGGGQLGELA